MSSPVRIAVVDKDRCKPQRCNQECKTFCPLERSGKEVISIVKKAVIDELSCIGCGICVKKCPFDAITVVNLTHEKGKLVHQYGINAFRLFNLPVIKEGAIIGLIGRNGIGKTTTLNILAGIIKPNLGVLDKEVDWEDIIERFRGSEIQNHLERLAEGRVEYSYKLQRVELLAERYGEKYVKELLDDVESSLIKELELGGLLERKVKHLSGGELQRVVIAKCLSKECEFYFIDEPTSFLDIKNRIDCAKTIRTSLKDKNKKAIVVEHDLVILDYLADFVHIVHGYPGAYGIISNIYHTRRGINSYLYGYIKEENIRFRDYSIEFSYIKESKEIKEKLLYIPHFVKTYQDSFFLEVEEAQIYKGEVIGILGRNALGKSTFVKILAGKESDDENLLGVELAISYKPQYISINYDGTVQELIFEQIEINEDLENHLFKPLEIKRIAHKDVRHLSGGELQKVALVLALSKESDIFLLDEPSAYLDIEERLRLAKILRRYAEQLRATLFVVDHDLLFLSSVSDRVMFFDGIPGKRGYANSPTHFSDAINRFLKSVGITMRCDDETKRPRINQEGSQKDKEMKRRGVFFEAL